MMPAYAVARTRVTNEREDVLVEFAETSDLNRVEMRDTKVGIIVAGALYNHVREALPEASTLKLGLTCCRCRQSSLRALRPRWRRSYVVESPAATSATTWRRWA